MLDESGGPWERQPEGLVQLAPWLPIPQILWFAPLWRDIVGGLAPTVTGTVTRAVSRGGVGASFQSGGILDFGDRFNEASFTNLLVFELPSLAATALSQSEYDNGASESLSSQYIDATAAGDIRLVRDGAAVVVETTAGSLIAAKREHWVMISWDQSAGSGFIAIDGQIRATATPGTQAWVTNGRYVLGRRRPADLSATSDHIQYVHARWARPFSQAEARRLTGGRYAELFAPRVEEVFEPPAGGGTDLLGQGVAAAPAQAAGEGRLLILGAGAAAAPAEAVGQGQALARADGASQAEAQAIGAGQVLMLADGVAAGAAQAAGAGQSQVRQDGVAAAPSQAVAAGDAVVPGVDTGVSVATGQAIGQGQILMRADGVASAAGQAAAAAQALARADGAAAAPAQAAGQGQALVRADGSASAPAQAIGTEESTAPPPPPAPAPSTGAGGGGAGRRLRAAAEAAREAQLRRQKDTVIAAMMLVISGALDE